MLFVSLFYFSNCFIHDSRDQKEIFINNKIDSKPNISDSSDLFKHKGKLFTYEIIIVVCWILVIVVSISIWIYSCIKCCRNKNKNTNTTNTNSSTLLYQNDDLYSEAIPPIDPPQSSDQQKFQQQQPQPQMLPQLYQYSNGHPYYIQFQPQCQFQFQQMVYQQPLTQSYQQQYINAYVPQNISIVPRIPQGYSPNVC